MIEKVPMTAQGHAAIEAELKHLRTVERQRIIKAIAEARTHGDLFENAEQLGFRAVLAKPFSISEFISAFNKVLS